MSTFTWKPAWGASQSVNPRVLVASFGDGYAQRVGDGINTMPRAWSLNFTQETAAIDLIEAFLRNSAGVTAFDWTPPTGAAGKFVCQEWTRTIASPTAHSISATFVEVFGA